MNEHDTHCCIEHGCRLGGDEDCPIATGERQQQNLCQQCSLETSGFYENLGKQLGEEPISPRRTEEEQRAYLVTLYEEFKNRPPRQIEKIYCLVCDKEMEFEVVGGSSGFVMDGGFLSVSFGYGSCYDQMFGHPSRKRPRGKHGSMYDLLTCDEIEAFICDECFKKKFDKMRGYDVRQERIRTKRFGG